MKYFLMVAGMALLLNACSKPVKEEAPENCNMDQALLNNPAKITITQGAYGMVSFTEGNCMPTIGPSSGCRTCPVARTVRFYEYTLLNQTSSSGNDSRFFDSFSTRLVAETTSDTEGFYQVSLPAGTYSMVVIENNKLYSEMGDGQGGIYPVTVSNGKVKADFRITYKAAF